jgi:hypothetical protein
MTSPSDRELLSRSPASEAEERADMKQLQAQRYAVTAPPPVLNRRLGVLSDLGEAARVTDLAEAASGLASRSEARRCGP